MLKILRKNYFLLIFLFLFLYFIFNLLDGERGLFSYFKKKENLKTLEKVEIKMSHEIKNLQTNNSLLSNKLDLDYIEILIRDKFLFGNKEETLYIITNNDN